MLSTATWRVLSEDLRGVQGGIDRFPNTATARLCSGNTEYHRCSTPMAAVVSIAVTCAVFRCTDLARVELKICVVLIASI